MQNTATQKMLELVTSVKDSAKRAEAEYERGAEQLQRMASGSMDLFGNQTLTRVADIASESRQICEGLYAAYQSLVGMLDAQCRPLLEQEPAVQAVGQVRDLIRWLNEESRLENNFTASLNQYDLGDVLAVRYFPTMANQMIQSFWENHYATMPGRQSVEEAVRSEKRAAAQARREAYLQREKENRARAKQEALEYRQRYQAWEAKMAEVEEKRQALIRDWQAALTAQLQEEIEVKYTAAEQALAQELEQLRERRTQLMAEVNQLKFYQLRQRWQLEREYETVTRHIYMLDERLSAVSNEKRRAEIDHRRQLEQKLPKWKQKAEAAVPAPQEPCPPGMTPEGFQMEKVNNAIVETLKKHKELSVKELMERCPALQGKTENTVNNILRRLNGERVECWDRGAGFVVKWMAKKAPKQKNPEKMLQAILAYVRQNGPCLVSDVVSGCPEVAALPPQKVSPLLGLLYERGELEMTDKNGKRYFEAV